MRATFNPHRFKTLNLLGVAVITLVAGLFIYSSIESTPKFIHRYQLRAADKTAVATVESKTSDYVQYTGIGRGNSEQAYDLALVSYTVNTATDEEKAYSSEVPVYTAKKGELVTIYYNSSDPSDATTEPEVLFTKEYWKTVTLFGAITSIIAIALIYLFSRGLKKQS